MKKWIIPVIVLAFLAGTMVLKNFAMKEVPRAPAPGAAAEASSASSSSGYDANPVVAESPVQPEAAPQPAPAPAVSGVPVPNEKEVGFGLDPMQRGEPVKRSEDWGNSSAPPSGDYKGKGAEGTRNPAEIAAARKKILDEVGSKVDGILAPVETALGVRECDLNASLAAAGQDLSRTGEEFHGGGEALADWWKAASTEMACSGHLNYCAQRWGEPGSPGDELQRSQCYEAAIYEVIRAGLAGRSEARACELVFAKGVPGAKAPADAVQACALLKEAAASGDMKICAQYGAYIVEPEEAREASVGCRGGLSFTRGAGACAALSDEGGERSDRKACQRRAAAYAAIKSGSVSACREGLCRAVLKSPSVCAPEVLAKARAEVQKSYCGLVRKRPGGDEKVRRLAAAALKELEALAKSVPALPVLQPGKGASPEAFAHLDLIQKGRERLNGLLPDVPTGKNTKP